MANLEKQIKKRPRLTSDESVVVYRSKSTFSMSFKVIVGRRWWIANEARCLFQNEQVYSIVHLSPAVRWRPDARCWLGRGSWVKLHWSQVDCRCPGSPPGCPPVCGTDWGCLRPETGWMWNAPYRDQTCPSDTEQSVAVEIKGERDINSGLFWLW